MIQKEVDCFPPQSDFKFLQPDYILPEKPWLISSLRYFMDCIFFSICIPYKSNTFLMTPSKLLLPWCNLCLLRHNEYSPQLLFISSMRRNSVLLKELKKKKGSFKETINIFLMTGFSKQKDLTYFLTLNI